VKALHQLQSRAISLNMKRERIVSESQDWGGSDAILQLIKCLLLVVIPDPWNILLCEVKQWSRMM